MSNQDPAPPARTIEEIDAEMKELREQRKAAREIVKASPDFRNKHLTILVTEAEREQLKQVAIARGFPNVAAYIRKRCGLED